MKLKDIQIGEMYLARVSGNLVPVQVLELHERSDWKGRTVRKFRCRNTRTGREITCSAARLRCPVRIPE